MDRVAEGIVRIVQPPFGPPAWEVSNVYFIGNGPVAMIDAGYPTPDSIAHNIKAWNDLGRPKIEVILVTHVHLDHMGGALEIQKETGAKIWAHAEEGMSLEQMLPQARIDREINDGDEFEFGGMQIRAVHLPGHTHGHMGYLDVKGARLFSGDLIVGKGYAVIVPPRGHMENYMESLRRLEKMKLEMILPGHGPVIRDPAAKIKEYITHRILREIQILKCLARGPREPKAMADEIYADLHPILRQAGELQVMAHLEKMEREGVVGKIAGHENRYESRAGELKF